MSVIKVKIQQHFTVLYNGVLENPRLSFKAKGVWAYCMSRPQDWEFHVSHLATVSKEKEDAIYSALKELMVEGLVEKIQPNENGRFGAVDYIIYPYPPELKKFLPQAGFPDAGFPDAGNPALLSTDPKEERRNEKEPPIYIPHSNSPPEKKKPLVRFGAHVLLKEETYKDFCDKYGKEPIDETISQVNDHIDANRGKPYRDYAAAIRTFLRNRKIPLAIKQTRAPDGSNSLNQSDPIPPRMVTEEEFMKFCRLTLQMFTEKQRYNENLKGYEMHLNEEKKRLELHYGGNIDYSVYGDAGACELLTHWQRKLNLY